MTPEAGSAREFFVRFVVMLALCATIFPLSWPRYVLALVLVSVYAGIVAANCREVQRREVK